MKIIVFSDSHGSFDEMSRALRRHKGIDVVAFCGDGHRDILEIQKQFPDKAYLAVKGNCDWYCDFANLITITLCNKKILVCHGHMQGVKEGLNRLVYLGQQEKADIILFGHTHHQLTTAESGMLILNPGSIGYNSTYSIVDIDENSGTITANEYPNDKYGPVIIK